MCNSGLKYKHCCGRNMPITGNSLRYISGKRQVCTDFEKSIFNALGYYPDDYIDPVLNIGEVIYVLIDESKSKKSDYYAISGIVVLKSELDRNQIVNSKLNDLVEKYNIDYIHFTEIFGHSNVLGDRRKSFIKEYIDIIKGLELMPFAVCMNITEIKNWLNLDSVTEEQCYLALTWKIMFNILIYVIPKYGTNIIIEMWRENDNTTDEKRFLHQINISPLIKQFPKAHISIYRHYITFSKTEILFSSLSDFLAYLTIRLYPRIQTNHDLGYFSVRAASVQV